MDRAFRCGLLCAAITMAVDVHGHPLDHLQTQEDVGQHKVPNRGTSHILVIPAWVGAPFPAADLDAMRVYYASEGGPGTFRQQWLDQSGGRYDPIPTLVDPVEYPTSCPIPSRTVDNCTIEFTDTQLITDGEVAVALADILSRVRDEQGLDLEAFDVNGKEGAADGYFDGVMIQSNVVSGVAAPLAVLGNETIVKSAPGGGGRDLSMGNVAMIPPGDHEFGHLLGFIDLYDGPPVNDLMAEGGYSDPNMRSSLGAFSRQQIGWGEVISVTPPKQIDLLPVLEGGAILRIGAAPRYLLIENRAGAKHDTYDACVPGLYVSSIDEDKLPEGSLGFLTPELELYLPNFEPPYLDVAVPVDCALYDAGSSACALQSAGETRKLVHASGETEDSTLRVASVEPNGAARVQIYAGDVPPDFDEEDGCAFVPAPAPRAPVWQLAVLILLIGARERTRTSTGGTRRNLKPISSPEHTQPVGSAEPTATVEPPSPGAAPFQAASAPFPDPVEQALADAITRAAAAERWDVVAQLARELEARRTVIGESNVVPLGSAKRRGKGLS